LRWILHSVIYLRHATSKFASGPARRLSRNEEVKRVLLRSRISAGHQRLFVMRTIAVVDDNASMLQGLNRLLSAHGFRVQTFASAELFLDQIAECEAEFLLFDVHLGGISGIDLQRQLISSGRSLPVIFMTAIDTEATREEALAVGCVAYLRKPFLARLLIDAINAAA
jgi:FixJ family two-component response regulator